MSKIIDIALLAKMPITKEFSELLFGIDSFNIERKVSFDLFLIWCDDLYYSFSENGNILSWEEDDKNNAEVKIFLNHFQIVRYIDNYLNSLKG